MSTQIQSVNLQTAVLMQIQEFIAAGQTFSRYDITKALRQKCNDGLMEIPECENTNPSSRYRFMIMKGDVDTIFDQLYANCLTNGLPPLKFDFNPQGGYRVFSVDQTVSTVTGAAPDPNSILPPPVSGLAIVPPTSTQVGYVSAIVSPTPAPVVQQPVSTSPSVKVSDSEIRRRVSLYMESCQKAGRTPTLHQIQSAIKRGGKSTGLSYGEINNICVSLGYKV